jgi:hypothetical protein
MSAVSTNLHLNLVLELRLKSQSNSKETFEFVEFIQITEFKSKDAYTAFDPWSTHSDRALHPEVHKNM